MTGELSGRVAIVTGAAGGLGRASALKLAGEGASVVVTDLQEENVQETVALIEAAGGKAVYALQDVTKDADWARVLELTKQTYGRLDILVNNAGITRGNRIEDTPLEEFRLINDTNMKGPYLGMQHCVAAMRACGAKGSIVNISSVVGQVGFATQVPYAAAKGGLRLVSKALALELAEEGIRVNSVHPGLIVTPMTAFHGDGKEASQGLIPFGHFGEPNDIASGVLFLASDRSRYVTGTELTIDGGMTAH